MTTVFQNNIASLRKKIKQLQRKVDFILSGQNNQEEWQQEMINIPDGSTVCN